MVRGFSNCYLTAYISSRIRRGCSAARRRRTFEVESAGTTKTMVRPEAVQAMRGIGIDISGHRLQSVDKFAGSARNRTCRSLTTG
jgi:hypothetical protein